MVIDDEKLKNELISRVNLYGLKHEQKDKIISALVDNISVRLSVDLFDHLSATEREELENILRSGGEDEALKYVRSKISDFSLLLQKNTEETINDFEKIRGQVALDGFAF